MTRTFFFLLLLSSFSALAGDLEDRNICIETLKKYQAEKWCDSDERKGCLSLHGAEWCDGSVELEYEAKFVDRQLNEMYQKLLRKSNANQRKLIRESQRVWLQYINLECNARYETMTTGDSVMRTNLWQGCKNEFLKSRAKEFESEYCSNLGGC